MLGMGLAERLLMNVMAKQDSAKSEPSGNPRRKVPVFKGKQDGRSKNHGVRMVTVR
jgi:hypothetical protein